MNKQIVKLEKYALDFRQRNGLSSTEPIRLKSVLLKNNILTIYLPMSRNFSGMAVNLYKNNETKRFILINCNQTLGRQHFTLCHEFYHLFYQKEFQAETSIVGKFNKKGNIEEYNADIFASKLILPKDGLLQMIPENEWGKNKISLKTILTIEHYYSCSRNALLHVLQSMDLIDKTHFDIFNVDKIKNALLYGYDSSLYKPANKGLVIGDYGIKARELFDKGIISESSYFSLLEEIGIDLSDFDNQIDYE